MPFFFTSLQYLATNSSRWEYEDDPKASGASRQRNQLFTLPATHNNIPNITFCNTGDDPDGRWLLSGDIEGNCYVWDLYTCRTVFTYRAWMCAQRTSDCACEGFRSRYPHIGAYSSALL